VAYDIPAKSADTGDNLPASTSAPADSELATGGLGADEVQNIVTQLIRDAKEHIEADISPARALATRFYKGEVTEPADEGRSSFVVTVVRDTVDSTIPGIMSAFYGPERVCEFVATKPEDVDAAEQASDYVQYVFMRDNPGYRIGLDVLKDACLKKLGMAKVWTEDLTETREQTLEFTSPELKGIFLELNPGLDIVRDEALELVIRHTTPKKRIRIEACPPEEIIWNRTARSPDRGGYQIIGHYQELKVADLVAMGYEEDEVLECASWVSSELTDNQEEQARNEHATGESDAPAFNDESQRPVIYVEAYTYLGIGGGQQALHKVCCIGQYHKVVKLEQVEDHPFAFAALLPEPHALLGSSLADKTMDLQRISSAVTRGTLDSLNLAINQRLEVVDGQVSMADLLNPEIGGIIRTSAPNMVREIKHTFVGADTLPFLQYLDELKENRTGVSKAAAGLNADSLQSSTQAAVAATVTGAQRQVEMLARTLAETFFKRLFWLVFKELQQNQDYERMVKLRGGYAKIDPRTWTAELDLEVHVPMALTMTDQKLEGFKELIAKQEQLMATLGPNNPLVSMAQYSYALQKMTELIGHRDSTRFFNQVSPEQAKALAEAAAQQPPQPSADIMLAQIEAQRAQQEFQIKQAELQLKLQEIQAKQEADAAKSEADAALEIQKLQMQERIELMKTEAQQAREMAKLEMEAQLAREKLAAEMALKQQELEMKAQLATVEAAMSADSEVEAAARDADQRVRDTEQQAESKVREAEAGAQVTSLEAKLAATTSMVEQMAKKLDAPAPQPPVIQIGTGGEEKAARPRKRKITLPDNQVAFVEDVEDGE
jgi:hypothetical protein